jgi:hypothetical protein
MEGGQAVSHLVNANKMVSDTPRMDASAYDDGAIWETGCDIERELTAANSIIRQQQLLEEENLRLQDRIKRLEEAHSWRWRSIETAPYNHTWVLGYDEKDGETGMIIFESGDESEPHWTDGMREWSPTHWMPLPDEPKAKEAKP